MKFSNRLKLVVSACLLVISSIAYAQLAQTPPMGWNSYNCFGSAVHEDEVKANVDKLVADGEYPASLWA